MAFRVRLFEPTASDLTLTRIWDEAQTNWRTLGSYVQKAGQNVWLPNSYLTKSEICPVSVLTQWADAEKQP